MIALFLISTLTLSSENLSQRMIKGPAESMGLLKESQQRNIFTEGHDSLIKTAYKMFKDKPIFGHGPKMFRVICKYEKYQVGIKPCDTHPHNFYIQLLAETGIVGFLYLVIVLFYVFYCVLKQLKSIIYKKKKIFI